MLVSEEHQWYVGFGVVLSSFTALHRHQPHLLFIHSLQERKGKDDVNKDNSVPMQ